MKSNPELQLMQKSNFLVFCYKPDVTGSKTLPCDVKSSSTTVAAKRKRSFSNQEKKLAIINLRGRSVFDETLFISRDPTVGRMVERV